MENLPECFKYTKTKLLLKSFSPRNDLCYCFFSEIREPENNDIITQNSTLFGVNALDIQRYRYYPATKCIYTFMGFANEDQLTKAMNTEEIKEASFNKSIYIYPFKKEYQQKNDDDTNLELPECKDYSMSHCKFQEFDPKEDLIYCFFAELVVKPKLNMVSSKFTELFGIKNSSDIQRFRYYPGTQKVYTFMGFSDITLFNNAMNHKIILSHSLNNSIFKYPYQKVTSDQISIQKPNENQDKAKGKKSQASSITNATTELPRFNNCDENDIEFKEFKPLKSIYYLFFSELTKPTKLLTNKEYKKLYSIDNSKDIQRFVYYPNTKNIYTFMGFKNIISRTQIIKCSNISEHALDGNVFIYPYDKSDKKEDVFNESIYHSSVLPNSTIYTKSDIKFNEFRPKKNLFYCFSAEIATPSKKLVTKKFENLFFIKNASDIQRFRYYPNTKKIYSFFGFTNTTKRNNAIKYSALKSASLKKSIR